MNVVDSGGWLEYFANGSNAAFFAPALEDTENLLVPALIVFPASAADFMAQGTAVSFNADTALNAALYSAKHQLALADSLILQISKEHHATLWTQDVDLKGHPGVQYKAKINKQ